MIKSTVSAFLLTILAMLGPFRYSQASDGFIVPGIVSDAIPKEKSCGGLLGSVPSINYLLRSPGDFVPFRQEWLLPKKIIIVDDDRLTPSDVTAIRSAEERQFRDEFGYYEAYDASGNIILTSGLAQGSNKQVNSADELLDFMRHLDQICSNRTRQCVSKIRMTHTHPKTPGCSLFSFGDVQKLFFIHALFEVLGGNEIELEQAIIYHSLQRDFRFFNNPSHLPYIKRTLRIPSGALSWLSNDYMLSRGASIGMKKLRDKVSGKARYSVPDELL